MGRAELVRALVADIGRRNARILIWSVMAACFVIYFTLSIYNYEHRTWPIYLWIMGKRAKPPVDQEALKSKRDAKRAQREQRRKAKEARWAKALHVPIAEETDEESAPSEEE